MTKSEIRMTNVVRMDYDFAFVVVKMDGVAWQRFRSKRAFPKDHPIDPLRDVFTHASFPPVAIPF